MMRFIRLLVLGIGVCAIGGTIVGTAVWAAVGAIVTGDFSRLLMLPVALPYAFLMVAPFGVAAGIFAAVTLSVLGRGRLRNRSQRAWTLTGTCLGAFGGALCPLTLVVAGWGPIEHDSAFLLAASSVLAGGACGAFLARIGWADYGA